MFLRIKKSINKNVKTFYIKNKNVKNTFDYEQCDAVDEQCQAQEMRRVVIVMDQMYRARQKN